MNFYGQCELDKIIFERFFSNKRNGFFVECGAYDGLVDSTCKFFEETMGWRGMNIEPVPYHFDRLIKNRPHCINEKYALSSENVKKTFTNAIHPDLGINFGNGSLNHAKEHMDILLRTKCKFDIFDVDCIRYIDLHIKHNLSEIDLFILDVEGHELFALEGIMALSKSFLPKVFCIETDHTSITDIFDKIKQDYDHHSKYMHNDFFIRKY